MEMRLKLHMLVLHGEGSKRPATAVTVLMIELSLLASFYGILLYKSTADGFLKDLLHIFATRFSGSRDAEFMRIRGVTKSRCEKVHNA